MFDFIKKLFSPDPKDLYRMGEVFILRGDYNGALRCYDQILELEPANIFILKKKSSLLFSLGMYKEVIDTVDVLLNIEPEDIDGLNGKALTMARQEKYEEAISFYERVLTLKPGNLEALTGKAFSLYSWGKYGEVITCTDQILVIDAGNSNTWTTRAMALAALCRLDEAIDCYDRALAIEPNHIDAWTGKGMALSAQGKYEEGVNCQRKAIELTSSLLPSLDPQKDTVTGAEGMFGYDKTNPIPVCLQDGQLEYLARLQCKCGCPFYFHRTGSFGTGPDGHIIDGYELVCRSKKHHITLYMDMYHEGASSLLPEGLSRGKEKGSGLPFYVDNFPHGLAGAIKEAEKFRMKS